MKSRILLVEDEPVLLEAIKMNLELDGFEVIATNDGRNALQFYHSQRFDLIILDVMLPHIDGFNICEQIRLYDTQIPIMFLTAKDTTADRIQGLRKGADEYLTKPFHLEEFQLRINNLLKRRANQQHLPLYTDVYTFGNNSIHFKTYKAIHADSTIQLTQREVKLLKLLIDRRNEVVSRQQILQTVWGYDVYPSTRTIDNFILAFRKYFEDDQRNPKYFHSIRGVGYQFTNPDEVA
jgi:two-component system alkaline phosphatase synthesis response regulator PhoP